ncbi:MAG: DUF115 domain-containing protein [Treponema sp.]|jgi:hypothetical protein|nr:DUF115 domain-containing protein [Treponema sp.]
MDRWVFFERNLLALSAHNPELCSRLSLAETTQGRYKFLESLSGELMPALVDRSGSAHALHSTVDPVREAERIVSTLQKDRNGLLAEGFVIFLGLGAGFAPLAALNNSGVSHVLVIDYDINGIAELFCARDYIALLGDPRLTLLVDPPPGLIESTVLELYRPALCGGIRALPLRARTDLDKQNFGAAGDAIQQTIEKVSADYSVQAYFGMRWFANIIRNLGTAQRQNRSAPPIREAAICAAGPSLDGQISLLAQQKDKTGGQGLFVISADTALPALLHGGVRPDAVVSIDCQHISYYHFMGMDCADIPLFLDIASPPMLPGFSTHPFFFSGGHPLAAYITQEWRPLPLLDTSGGNVTYACLSLAESLGAQRITVYGADFSYPAGRVYARGTYIFPFFERRQERRSPLEAQLSSFLYRSPFLPSSGETVPLYETAALRLYRTSFERKASAMEAHVSAAPGPGIPLSIRGKSPSLSPNAHSRIFSLFAPGKMVMNADEFLEQYRRDIAALPVFSNANGTVGGIAGGAYLRNLGADERRVFATLLPQTAAIRHRRPELAAPELIEAVKNYCVNEIDKVLNGGLPKNLKSGSR